MPMTLSLNCPNCTAPLSPPFYSVPGIPVQSNLLMSTQAEAAACPTGDLTLAFCPACGFVTNTAFDLATQEQSARYEATQGFSPTFNSFAKSLAARWAQRYELRGRTALEIGAGRGEFISLLCQTAECHGIGIDPIADPAKPPTPGDPRVRLIADYYSEKYAHLPADFICCRHTLEHLPQTQAFLGMLRRVIGDRLHTVVAFEVPDTLRVLQEGAFWDLYYEHCSYFTPGSLARLFRSTGFDLIDLRREFDGQYIIIEARPATAITSPSMRLENDLRGMAETVSRFPAVVEQNLARWRGVIQNARSTGRPVALWGSGSKAVGFLTTLRIGADLLPYVVDINPHKQGTHLPGTGQQIVAPEVLRAYQPDTVIAMNPVYREEIAEDLRRLGVNAELLTL